MFKKNKNNEQLIKQAKANAIIKTTCDVAMRTLCQDLLSNFKKYCEIYKTKDVPIEYINTIIYGSLEECNQNILNSLPKEDDIEKSE